MGKKGYDKCKAVIEKIIQDGTTKEIDGKTIKRYVMRYIGSDDRTLNRYILLIREYGFIRPIGNGVFEITKEVNNL